MTMRKALGATIHAFNQMRDAADEAAKLLEEVMGEEEGEEEEEEEDEAPKRSSRKSRSKKKTKASRRSKKDEDEDEEPTASDVVKACRGALKVLDKKEVTKIVKKYGKATAPARVPAQYRRKVIDAIEEALEDE